MTRAWDKESLQFVFWKRGLVVNMSRAWDEEKNLSPGQESYLW